MLTLFDEHFGKNVSSNLKRVFVVVFFFLSRVGAITQRPQINEIMNQTKLACISD